MAMPPPPVETLLLPLEVFEVIGELSSLQERLVLCRVSKVFRSFITRSIYRDIALESSAKTVACCRTLAANEIAANAVRQLSISYTPAEPTKAHYFPSFYHVIARALSSVSSHLQVLRLMVYDPGYISVLSNSLRFPNIWRFECFLTLTHRLLGFLNTNSAITCLQIAPHENLSIQPQLLQQLQLLPQATVSVPYPKSEPESYVCLPSLQYFTGNAEFLARLAPGCSLKLRAAFLFWDAIYATPRDAIRALSCSSAQTLNILSVRRQGWNLDLFEAVSQCLPELYVLSVTNMLVVDARPNDVYLNAVESLLPRFSALRRLHLHCVDMWKPPNVRCILDDDYRTVCSWGAACPSLIECVLPHSNGLRWIRVPLPLVPLSSSGGSRTSMESSCSYIWLLDPNDPNMHPYSSGVEWTWNMLFYPSVGLRRNSHHWQQHAQRWATLSEFVQEQVSFLLPRSGADGPKSLTTAISGRPRGMSGPGTAAFVGVDSALEAMQGRIRSRSRSLNMSAVNRGWMESERYEAVMEVLRSFCDRS